jgi:hypothetical protein
MGFLDEKPVAKIVSGAILLVTTTAFVTGITPAENTDVLTILIGGAMGFLFASSSPKLS